MKVCLSICFITLILSCNRTQVMSAAGSQNKDTTKVAEPFLQKLQQENEVVLAFAIESYAWVKSVDYRIIAMNKGQWKGYHYYKRITGGPMEQQDTIIVSPDTCNNIWSFIQSKEAWKIKSDNGEFCDGEKKKNCNINDGVTWHLYILSKNKVADAAYYEPAFYEECCPGNAMRKLFVEVSNKVREAVHVVNE